MKRWTKESDHAQRLGPRKRVWVFFCAHGWSGSDLAGPPAPTQNRYLRPPMIVNIWVLFCCILRGNMQFGGIYRGFLAWKSPFSGSKNGPQNPKIGRKWAIRGSNLGFLGSGSPIMLFLDYKKTRQNFRARGAGPKGFYTTKDPFPCTNPHFFFLFFSLTFLQKRAFPKKMEDLSRRGGFEPPINTMEKTYKSSGGGVTESTPFFLPGIQTWNETLVWRPHDFRGTFGTAWQWKAPGKNFSGKKVGPRNAGSHCGGEEVPHHPWHGALRVGAPPPYKVGCAQHGPTDFPFPPHKMHNQQQKKLIK